MPNIIISDVNSFETNASPQKYLAKSTHYRAPCIPNYSKPLVQLPVFASQARLLSSTYRT
jgi:hypothetical protein